MMTTTTAEGPPPGPSYGFRIEGSRTDLSIICGRLDVYARVTEPRFRWAWLALVKEGPSIEAVAGPFEVTVSWGAGSAQDKARVWAWRRGRNVPIEAAVGED